MTKTIKINGQLIETKVFKTSKAANNFISKKEGREVVFLRAREIYVSI